MRKILPLVGIVAAALLATSGCTAGSAGSAASGGTVELTYWSWAPNLDRIVETWNGANPGIHVTVNKQDGGDPAVTKLLTAIKAGSGAPDIVQAEYQKIPTLVSANAIADIATQTSGLGSQFPESVWAAVTLGSKAVYGLPQDSAPMMFFYRADVFAALAMAVPTTWQEYANAARKIHAADQTKYLGTFSSTDPGWFAGLAQQAGASWWGVKGQAWNVAIDQPATRKVAEYWGGLVAEGAIANSPMYTPDWNAALNDGTQVGWLGAVWGPGVLEGNAVATKGKWRAAALPQWDAAKPASGNWGGSATSVTTQCKHRAEATKFITWLNTDPTAIKALATTANVYPAASAASRVALSSPPAFLADQSDYYAIAEQAARTTNPFTYGPNVNVAYSAYTDAFGKAAQARQATQFTEALAAMQRTTVDDMRRSGFTLSD